MQFGLRDHPFKTSSCSRGKGSKIGQICRQIVVKTANARGVGVKNLKNLLTSLMDGPFNIRNDAKSIVFLVSFFPGLH